jgi:hypothetical protein
VSPGGKSAELDPNPNLKKMNYCISWPIRCTMIFSLEILGKNNDECILILVIYLKKIGLLHTKISNHNIFITETQKIVVTATNIIFMVVFTRCGYGYL